MAGYGWDALIFVQVVERTVSRDQQRPSICEQCSGGIAIEAPGTKPGGGRGEGVWIVPQTSLFSKPNAPAYRQPTTKRLIGVPVEERRWRYVTRHASDCFERLARLIDSSSASILKEIHHPCKRTNVHDQFKSNNQTHHHYSHTMFQTPNNHRSSSKSSLETPTSVGKTC